MKILYAAQPTFSSYLQMKRCYPHLNNHTVRLCGYSDYLYGASVDYTLDGFNIINKYSLRQLMNEIDSFEPDLVISDLSSPVSFCAKHMGIPYWIVSSGCIVDALPIDTMKGLQIGKKFSQIKNSLTGKYHKQIEGAARVLIYSHVGDCPMSPLLKSGFEWVRPYTVGSDRPGPGQFIACFDKVDKEFVRFITGLGYLHLYSPYSYEPYRDCQHRDLSDSEYQHDIANCLISFSRGETTFIADAFYNQRHSLTFPDLTDPSTLVNSYLSSYFEIGEILTTRRSYEQINDLQLKEIKPTVVNKQIKFLHELVI